MPQLERRRSQCIPRNMTKTLAVQLGGSASGKLHPSRDYAHRAHAAMLAHGRRAGRQSGGSRETQLRSGLAARQCHLPHVRRFRVAYVTAFLASDKSWAISGELVVANGWRGPLGYY